MAASAVLAAMVMMDAREFRQHDGMVTMMMFYQRRASPKHRYDMIEVDYGGGGHRTRLRD